MLIDSEVDQYEQEIKDRWVTKLDNAHIWAASQCRTALVYFDCGVGPRPPLTRAPTLTGRGRWRKKRFAPFAISVSDIRANGPRARETAFEMPFDSFRG